MRIYITFGDEAYRKTRDFSVKMAKLVGGFDKVIAYSPADIDIEFQKTHSDIFKIKRGYGLWLWKPFLIYKTLMEVCNDGDYLFYGDGGSFFFRSVETIEKSMQGSDIWVSCNSLVEWQFTKRDTFELMDCHGKEYEKTPQAQGGFLYIRKSPVSISFVKQWLDKCSDIRLLHPDNIASSQENPEGFVAHREDQSVLSLLCKKKGIKFHLDPSQYGKYPEKYWQSGVERPNGFPMHEYSPSIILHRTPSRNVLTIVRQLVLCLIPRKIGLRLIHK